MCNLAFVIASKSDGTQVVLNKNNRSRDIRKYVIHACVICKHVFLNYK